MYRSLLTIVFCALAAVRPGVAAQPNIVFFLADDQRHNAMGCAGHTVVQTPTMDHLARHGVRFRNAFVTTSICAASRASYFTGLVERTHRYTFGTMPISASHCDESYPAVLRKAGYQTAFIGKFGVRVEGDSRDEMFDFFQPYGRHPYFKKQPDGSTRHISQLCGDTAIEFLRTRDKTKPFCLSVSFNAPHAEDADKEDHYPPPKVVADLYAGETMPLPELSETSVFESQPEFLKKSMNRDRWYWRWDTPAKYQKNIRNYYRMISGIDHVMGRVLEELETLELEDDTVIVFSGDNGYYAGSRGFAGKWSHYEESLRIPMIIMDPRLDPSRRNQTVDATVLNIDVTATIVDLASDAETPGGYQGKSLLPWLKGDEPAGWRHDFWCEHLMDNASIPKWEGVRDNRWVYARYFQQSPKFEFLHDLESDPKQLVNLVADRSQAAQLEVMRNRCDELKAKYGGEYVPNPNANKRKQKQN